MHIVLANQWYPPESGWGGVGMYNYVMAHALTALGHEVSLITSRLDAQTPAREVRDGIAIERILIQDAYRLRRLPILGRQVRALQQLRYSQLVARALQKLHGAKPVDVVEFAEVNAEGYFFTRQPTAPVVVRCHTPTAILAQAYVAAEMPYAIGLSMHAERAAARRAHALSAPSRDMARVAAKLFDLPAERITPIANPLPLSDIAAYAPNTTTDTLTILHVGRLDRVKGVEVLVDAIAQVVAQIPQARFVFAGADRRAPDGGSERARLETRLDASGMRAHVEFLGAVSATVLNEWYARADICVVPSLLYESFSYTCAQAMAAGRAVVASRIGGIPETVADGETGLLVAPGDATALADALIRLARDAELRASMGRAGRAQIARDSDPTTIARQTLALYARAAQTFASRA